MFSYHRLFVFYTSRKDAYFKRRSPGEAYIKEATYSKGGKSLSSRVVSMNRNILQEYPYPKRTGDQRLLSRRLQFL